jgi:hypothetical protein
MVGQARSGPAGELVLDLGLLGEILVHLPPDRRVHQCFLQLHVRAERLEDLPHQLGPLGARCDDVTIAMPTNLLQKVQ